MLTRLLGLCACATVPVYDVPNAPVVGPSGKALQASQVRQAIVTAGIALGWRMTDAGPGRLEGMLNLRTHGAVVDIPYSATQNLERGIRSEISRL